MKHQRPLNISRDNNQYWYCVSSDTQYNNVSLSYSTRQLGHWRAIDQPLETRAFASLITYILFPMAPPLEGLLWSGGKIMCCQDVVVRRSIDGTTGTNAIHHLLSLGDRAVRTLAPGFFPYHRVPLSVYWLSIYSLTHVPRPYLAVIACVLCKLYWASDLQVGMTVWDADKQISRRRSYKSSIWFWTLSL